tara:strand:+ start:1019 stop:1561 length:543 start_codon:yes stop_codon:yes gene_type:complete
MNIIKTPIDDLLVLEPDIYKDERGSFFESYNKIYLSKKGIDINFTQDNQSLSKKNILRGLHFQNPPFEQGKLVRVITGSVLDVAVDIRSKSKTYGRYFSIHLTGENNKMLWIPPGFAHGFLSLQDDTIFSYKCSAGYNKDSESSLIWNDKDLNIDWGIKDPILSNKDTLAMKFIDFKSQF